VSSEQPSILDTVVLLYFLLVGQEALLTRLLGEPLRVPLAVYDPEERSLPPEALRHSDLLSEMRQAIRHYEVAARADPERSELLARLRRIDLMYEQGKLAVVELSADERTLAARLQSRREAAEFGLGVPLGPGEAACVAGAFARGWTVATDDHAALTALRTLSGPDSPYERIRKLLVRAVDEGLVTRAEAREIHDQMRQLGFWDSMELFA
jgi:PIN domain nuclease of toxin-antitoxin system